MSDQNQSGSRGNGNKRGRGSNRGSSNPRGGHQNQRPQNENPGAPRTQNKDQTPKNNQDKNAGQNQEREHSNNRGRGNNKSNNKPRGNKQDKSIPSTQPVSKTESKERELKKNSPSIENQKVDFIEGLTGRVISGPAISEKLALKTEFIKYLPTENQLDKLEVESTLRVINNDLSQFLSTPFYVFWSTIKYNRSLTEFLDSFLRYFQSRNLIGISGDEDEMKPSNATTPVEKQRRQVFIRVWSVIKRMTELVDETNPTYWMSESYYSNLIWKVDLFHIPTLIDIAVLYSNYKRKEIISIFSFLFSVQPKIFKELTQVFGQIKNTVDQLTANIETVQEVIMTPTPISEDGKQIALADFRETAEFFSNIFTSLVIFLDLCPLDCFFALKNYKIFRDSFVHIYEVTVTKLNTLASKIDESESIGIKIDIGNLKTAILQLFTKILLNCFVTPLTKTQSMSDYNEMEAADEYLTIIYQLPTTSNFLRKKLNLSVVKGLYPGLLIDLEAKIHLRDSLDTISQALPSLESHRIKRVIQVIDTHCGPRSDQVTHKPTMKVVEQSNSNSNQISASRLEKIKNLKEIFPDYGEGFLNECLQIYSDDIEKVTDRIFGESLAEPLLAIDRSLPLPSSQAPAAATQIQSISPPVRRKPEIPASELQNYQRGKKKMDISQQSSKDIKLFNSHYVSQGYNDEYDDSMDQYATFGMTEGETNDESTTLTDSGSMVLAPEEDETPAAKNAKTKAKKEGEHHGPKPQHKIPAHKKKKRFVPKQLAQVPRSNASQS